MHKFDQSCQRLVLRRDKVGRLERGVVVGVLGHEAVVSARHGRRGSQEVYADELKPSRDLGLARLVAIWLIGALVNLADVAHGQRVSKIDSRLGDVPHGLYDALVWISQVLVPDVCLAIVLAGIAGVAVAVAFGNLGVVVGTAKDVVTMKVEATLMTPPLVRRAPRAEAVSRSSERLGAAIDVALDGRVGRRSRLRGNKCLYEGFSQNVQRLSMIAWR